MELVSDITDKDQEIVGHDPAQAFIAVIEQNEIVFFKLYRLFGPSISSTFHFPDVSRNLFPRSFRNGPKPATR